MVVESFNLADQIVSAWSLTTTLARSQPLGAAIVLVLLSDAALTALGGVADRWEAAAERRFKRRQASRSAATPPAYGAEPAP